MSRPIQKVLRINQNLYYITHLSLVNALLPVKMTPREVEIIARVMEFEGDLANDKFGTSAKKILKRDLNLTDGGLGNFMKSLKEKRIIRDTGSGWDILPILQNSPDSQIYNFKLINVDKS